jgi:holo-[acyl-carrier protein] synthase
LIIGVGTDIVSVQRIESALKNEKFINRILMENEQNRIITAEYVAGRWAAKEAIKKCLPYLNEWHQVEIVGTPGTVPKVVICHPNFDAEQLKVHLSISHERDMAVAFAVIEKIS